MRRLLHVDAHPIVIEFSFDQDAGSVRVTLVSNATRPGQIGPGARPPHRELRKIAEGIWGLHDDLRRCHALLRRDRSLAPLLKRNAGVRLVRAPSLYEALMVAVIGQQLSVYAAEAIRHRLLTTMGDRVVINGIAYFGYPTPRQLLAGGTRALAAPGISRAKVRYLLEIAERVRAGELDPTAFASLPDEEAIARLMELPGVGRWTAEIALMRGLGRTDVFPAADLGLTVAVQRLMGMRARPTERDLRTLAERWKGWRSYAALYLWTTLTPGA